MDNAMEPVRVQPSPYAPKMHPKPHKKMIIDKYRPPIEEVDVLPVGRMQTLDRGGSIKKYRGKRNPETPFCQTAAQVVHVAIAADPEDIDLRSSSSGSVSELSAFSVASSVEMDSGGDNVPFARNGKAGLRQALVEGRERTMPSMTTQERVRAWKVAPVLDEVEDFSSVRITGYMQEYHSTPSTLIRYDYINKHKLEHPVRGAATNAVSVPPVRGAVRSTPVERVQANPPDGGSDNKKEELLKYLGIDTNPTNSRESHAKSPTDSDAGLKRRSLRVKVQQIAITNKAKYNREQEGRRSGGVEPESIKPDGCGLMSEAEKRAIANNNGPTRQMTTNGTKSHLMNNSSSSASSSEKNDGSKHDADAHPLDKSVINARGRGRPRKMLDTSKLFRRHFQYSNDIVPDGHLTVHESVSAVSSGSKHRHTYVGLNHSQSSRQPELPTTPNDTKAINHSMQSRSSASPYPQTTSSNEIVRPGSDKNSSDEKESGVPRPGKRDAMIRHDYRKSNPAKEVKHVETVVQTPVKDYDLLPQPISERLQLKQIQRLSQLEQQGVKPVVAKVKPLPRPRKPIQTSSPKSANQAEDKPIPAHLESAMLTDSRTLNHIPSANPQQKAISQLNQLGVSSGAAIPIHTPAPKRVRKLSNLKANLRSRSHVPELRQSSQVPSPKKRRQLKAKPIIKRRVNVDELVVENDATHDVPLPPRAAPSCSSSGSSFNGWEEDEFIDVEQHSISDGSSGVDVEPEAMSQDDGQDNLEYAQQEEETIESSSMKSLPISTMDIPTTDQRCSSSIASSEYEHEHCEMVDAQPIAAATIATIIGVPSNPKNTIAQVPVLAALEPLINTSPLDASSGCVVAVLTTDGTGDELVVVQEREVSFWRRPCRVYGIFGVQYQWKCLGSVERLLKDTEVQTPYQHRVFSTDDHLVYFECRAKQLDPTEIRECHMTAVFACVYHVDAGTGETRMSMVDLDTVQGMASSVRYTVLDSSKSIAMCWSQQSLQSNRCGICRYTISPELDSLSGVLEFPFVQQNVLSLTCLEDDKLIGFGETSIVAWDTQTGDMLLNLDIEQPIGFCLNCFLDTAQTEKYMFLIHLIPGPKAQQLQLLAINLSGDCFTWKVVHQHELPADFVNVSTYRVSADHLVVIFADGQSLLLSICDPTRLYLRRPNFLEKAAAVPSHPVERHQAFVLDDHMVRIFEDRMSISTICDHFMDA